MRYFIDLAYNGTNFSGWQRQPNAPSVQETIEMAFATLLRQPIEITGCGRTDAGVHARHYTAHFDFAGAFPTNFLNRLNKFICNTIVIKSIYPVEPDAHARFGAVRRAYEYHITFVKNPFFIETQWFYADFKRLNTVEMQAAAALLCNYTEFFPFCKTHSDSATMSCHLFRCEWVFESESAVLHIAANRFLRGMVRLIVGMCINVGTGQLDLKTVQSALDQQILLKKSYSVPPNGLFLTEILY
jgi:tRNA pseudouridine38-40 synthase